MAIKPFRFVNVVWGEKFIRFFTELSLASELSPNNLPYLCSRAEVEYHIYTRATDEQLIRNSPAYERLQQLCRTEFHIIEQDVGDLIRQGSQSEMAACHSHFISRYGREGDSNLVFCAPDHLLADGAYSNMLRLVQSGKRLIALSTFRLDKAGVVAAINSEGLMPGLEQGAINSRRLVSLALDNLHPLSKSLIWGAENFNSWPSILFFPVENEGWLIRQFHLHSLLIAPEQGAISSGNSLDSDFILHAVPDAKDVHVVTDSDEICILELSERKDFGVIDKEVHPLVHLSRWASGAANSRHLEFVQQSIRIHATNCSAKWREKESEAEGVVQSVLPLVKEVRSSAAVLESGIGCVLLPSVSNSAADVREMLGILTEQSLQPQEVIVVCKEELGDLASLLGAVVPTLEMALKLATSDFLHFMRPGRSLHPDFLRRSMHLLAQYPQAGVCLSGVMLSHFTEDEQEEGLSEGATNRTHTQRHTKFYFHPVTMQTYFRPAEFLSIVEEKTSPWLDLPQDSAIFNRRALSSLGLNAKLGDTWQLLATAIAALRQGLCFIPEPLVTGKTRTWLSRGRLEGIPDAEQVKELKNALIYIEDFPALEDVRSSLRHLARFLAKPIDTLRQALEDERLYGYLANGFVKYITLAEFLYAKHIDAPRMLEKFRKLTERVEESYRELEDGVVGAKKAYQEGEFNTAYEIYSSLAQRYVSSPDVHFGLAQSALEIEKLEESQQAAEQVISLCAANPPALVKTGLLIYKQGRIARAKEVFSRVVSLDPANVDAHNNLAVLCLEQGETQQALLHLELALHGDPDSLSLLTSYGLVALQVGKKREASQALGRALELDSSRADLKQFYQMSLQS